MDNSRESSERGVEPQVAVETQADVDPQAGVNRHHEAEIQQLLPFTSPAHSCSRANSIRSHRASISNVSSSSIMEPGGEDPQWIPFALRWYCIMIAAGYSITFAAIVFALYRHSHDNNGLCTEDSAIPGWKFIPTLIAVVYTQLTAMILGAVKRTEPFARMAKTSGRVPVARYTLLEKTKPWWTTLARGFHKRRNGGSWNWLTILASSIYILAILGVSPMSAALLSTKEVQQTSSEALVQLTMRNGSTLHPRAERDTYLRTMGALFQNYSTSPWITDGFVILPFWPEDSVDTGSPWDSQVLDSGTWEADTTIYHNDLICTKLSMSKKDFYLRHAYSHLEANSNEELNQASVLLESNHSCRFNLTVNVLGSRSTPLSNDWVSWSDMNSIILGSSYAADAIISVNQGCHEDEIIVMSTPWWSERTSTPITRFLENMTMLAYACHSEHSMAIIPARATSASGTLSVQFDEDLFQQMRTPVPSTVLDLLELRKIYTDLKWSQFIPQKSLSDPRWEYRIFGGAGAMLGIEHNFSASRMMADPNLPMTAAQFRRRFFAEIVGDSLQRNKILEERRTTGRQLESVRKVLVSGQAASILCALLLTSSLSFLAVLWVIHATKHNLNLYQDPSTLLGSCIWGSGNAMVLRKFRKLDLATRKMLKEELADRVFFSKHGKLDETEANVRADHRKKTRLSSSGVAPKLSGLRLRSLALLVLYVLGLLAGIVVLYEYARRSGLHQAFFTYRASIKVLGNANTISPFAIIPTLLAIVVTLWWESVDTTCRTIQPYISMQHDARCPSQGIILSYVSSIWLFASSKALKNRHWLLSLVTTTTFLLQVLTIAMSALFDSGNGVLTSFSEIPQTLELRNVPFVRQAPIGKDPQSSRLFDFDVTPRQSAAEFGEMVQDSLYDLDTDWMYTAIIQMALKGSEPVWSRDDWSFVPVSSVPDDPASAKHKNSVFANDRLLMNLTVQTPAIRARLECSVVEWTRNLSLWLFEANQSTGNNNLTGLDSYFLPTDVVYDGNFTTRLTAQASFPQCCANNTGDTPYNPAVIAYWTENWSSSVTYPDLGGQNTTGNFTVKWIRGSASFGWTSSPHFDKLYYPEPPAIQALNCMPTFESSRAEVTVEPRTGVVQQYRILDTPLQEDVAWSDIFQWRNVSKDAQYISTDTTNYENKSQTTYYYNVNITTSYGPFFMKSLLSAANIPSATFAGPHRNDPNSVYDVLEDKIFNMRDNTTGLNLDFMSYAAYAQVGFDPTALLDSEVLAKASQKVFSTFFQHFVSNNLSQEHGGYVYQPRGADLKVNPPLLNMRIQHTHDGSVAPKFQEIVRNTNATTTATITTRVEVLRMNLVAFWIVTSILIWLIITIIILASVQRKYYGGMMRNVECIADVLVLIAGSERLLAVIREKGFDTILKEDKIMTRLGWFRDPDGTMRWRIDLVEEKETQMRTIRLGPSYAPVPDGDEGGGGDNVSRSSGSVQR